MRQFKFRAWHPQYKMFDHLDFDCLLGDGRSVGLYVDSKVIPLHQFELMQYLGEDCKDCDGVEVCEGDIVKFVGSEKEVGVIVYHGHYFRMEYKIGGHVHFAGDYDFKWNRVRKIGNIHQNPELLK